MIQDNLATIPGSTIGMSVFVSFNGIGNFKSTLVGMDYGHCLILKLPMRNDVPLKLFEQNYFVVRYVYESHIYGFRTSLLSLIREPILLFVLDYPREVETINLRKYERYDCFVPATVKNVIADKATLDVQGYFRDISMTGCRFEALRPDYENTEGVDVGDIVKVSVDFPNCDCVVTLQAEIKNMSVSSNELQLGLIYSPNLFLASHQEAMEAIKSFIEYIQNLDKH